MTEIKTKQPESGGVLIEMVFSLVLLLVSFFSIIDLRNSLQADNRVEALALSVVETLAQQRCLDDDQFLFNCINAYLENIPGSLLWQLIEQRFPGEDPGDFVVDWRLTFSGSAGSRVPYLAFGLKRPVSLSVFSPACATYYTPFNIMFESEEGQSFDWEAAILDESEPVVLLPEATTFIRDYCV